MDGLRGLVRALRSSQDFLEILEMTAEQARAALAGRSLSLSEWDRDLGRLVTRVNVGDLASGEVRFPKDEIYLLSRDAVNLLEGKGFLVQADDDQAPEPDRTILRAASMASGVTMPVASEGRLWGELWVTRGAEQAAYDVADLDFARDVAQLVGEVVAAGQLLERTARMAFEDPLTRLGNRRVFDDRVAELLDAGVGPGATLVLFDLNGLKEINDDSGHATGDRVITLAADALSVVASRTEGAVATRIGGDEFALLLPGDQRVEAVTLAHQAASLLGRGRERATMSCGVASAMPGTPSRTLVATTDAALYAAKRRGAQVVLASDLAGEPPADALDDQAVATVSAEWGAAPMRRTDGPARRAPHRRRWDDGVDRAYPADASAAVADALRLLAEGLPELPSDVPGAMRWVGDTLLAPLDLDRWTLSRVDLGREPRVLVLDSLGMSQARLPVPPNEPLVGTEPQPVEDAPTAWRAALERRMFSIAADDRIEGGDHSTATAAERDLLRGLGLSFVVGAGATDGDHAWVLLLCAATDRVPVPAVREVAALALAAAGLGIDPTLQG